MELVRLQWWPPSSPICLITAGEDWPYRRISHKTEIPIEDGLSQQKGLEGIEHDPNSGKADTHVEDHIISAKSPVRIVAFRAAKTDNAGQHCQKGKSGMHDDKEIADTHIFP